MSRGTRNICIEGGVKEKREYKRVSPSPRFSIPFYLITNYLAWMNSMGRHSCVMSTTPLFPPSLSPSFIPSFFPSLHPSFFRIFIQRISCVRSLYVHLRMHIFKMKMIIRGLYINLLTKIFVFILFRFNVSIFSIF